MRFKIIHKSDLTKKDKQKQEQILFDKYISKNLSKFINDFNFFVQEFSGFFKPEMNCTLMSIKFFFSFCQNITFQMLSV